MKAGRQTVCTIISKLDDPDSNGAERVVIKDAVFDELILANWLAKTLGEEQVNFTFSNQEIYIREEEKQTKTTANSMLQGITKEATVTALGNTSCISGKMIRIEGSLTKLVGSFYIKSDEHEWISGKYDAKLNLNLT